MDTLVNYLGLKLSYNREMMLITLMAVRTLPMIFLTPFLGGKLVPSTVKMGLGGLFVALAYPLATRSASHVPITAIPFLLLLLKEAFVGFAIGFLNSHVFWVMDMAGRMIDTVRGTSMSEVMVPHSKQRVTPTGNMYYHLMLIFFMAIGGHYIFIETYFFSFELLPVDRGFIQSPAFGEFFDFMMSSTAKILLMATILAAPAIAATFITDIVFGILNRVAPQLNAYFMSMPVKAMAGVVMVLVALDAFVQRMEHYTTWSLLAVEKALIMLGAGG